MFYLDQAIAEWRQQMLAAGIKTPVPLDELENHLRDDVEQQVRSGVDPQQAFEAGVRRIGQASVLEVEFEKSRGTIAARSCEQKLVMMRYSLAVIYLLIGAYLFGFSNVLVTACGMSVAQRILGSAAIALDVVVMCAGPHIQRFLPVVTDKRIHHILLVLGFTILLPVVLLATIWRWAAPQRVIWIIVSFFWITALSDLSGLVRGPEEVTPKPN